MVRSELKSMLHVHASHFRNSLAFTAMPNLCQNRSFLGVNGTLPTRIPVDLFLVAILKIAGGYLKLDSTNCETAFVRQLSILFQCCTDLHRENND